MSCCKIEPPEGFVAPEPNGEDGAFDLVCTFKPCGDGKLMMTRLGDSEMPEEDEDEKEKPSINSYANELATMGRDSEMMKG